MFFRFTHADNQLFAGEFIVLGKTIHSMKKLRYTVLEPEEKSILHNIDMKSIIVYTQVGYKRFVQFNYRQPLPKLLYKSYWVYHIVS